MRLIETGLMRRRHSRGELSRLSAWWKWVSGAQDEVDEEAAWLTGGTRSGRGGVWDKKKVVEKVEEWRRVSGDT